MGRLRNVPSSISIDVRSVQIPHDDDDDEQAIDDRNESQPNQLVREPKTRYRAFNLTCDNDTLRGIMQKHNIQALTTLGYALKDVQLQCSDGRRVGSDTPATSLRRDGVKVTDPRLLLDCSDERFVELL